MKSELFLMRTVKSRALLRLNETFYFLLCRVIASFKSSSTTCQARSCMIINTLRKYCFFFATIFNDIQNFWITVKVIKFNVKRNYPYHFIFAAITCKKTKKKNPIYAYASNAIWNISNDSNSFKFYKFLTRIEFVYYVVHLRRFDNSISFQRSNIPYFFFHFQFYFHYFVTSFRYNFVFELLPEIRR